MYCTRCGVQVRDEMDRYCSQCGAATPNAKRTAEPMGAPRRLTRSVHDKKIGGVCGGFAEYLGLDPTLVRLVTLAIALFTGIGFLVYLLFWMVMPRDNVVYVVAPYGTPGNPAHV